MPFIKRLIPQKIKEKIRRTARQIVGPTQHSEALLSHIDNSIKLIDQKLSRVEAALLNAQNEEAAKLRAELDSINKKLNQIDPQ